MLPPLPPYLIVGPHRYAIYGTSKDVARICRALKFPVDADGVTNHRTCEIGIDAKQHFTQKQDTLLHEVLHCVWRDRDWDTPRKIDEESIVKRLSASLLDTLQR